MARLLGDDSHGNIWIVPDADNRTESGRVRPPLDPTEESRSRWRPSLWLWPVPAIGLATIAGTLYGPTGAIVAGEALAALALTSGILLFSRDRWLTFGHGRSAHGVSVVALAASIRLQPNAPQEQPSARRAASMPAAVQQAPVGLPWRKISQAMVSAADLRGFYLDGANLDGLQLSGKDFDGAQADGASFRGSQLEHAILNWRKP